MKTPDHIPDVLKSIETFVQRSLKGRYRDYVADKFLVLLLQYEFYRQYSVCRSTPNAAYMAGQLVFEMWLEHGCGVKDNGHHVAQKFGEYLEKK